MKIGIDIDDCLGDFLTSFCEFHNETYSTGLKPEDFISYNFALIIGEDSKERVAQFYKSTHFHNIQPWEDSQEAVKKLAEKHELYIITSRFGAFDITLDWLNKYFPNTFSKNNVHFTANGYEGTSGRTKKEFCEKLGLDYLIEDSLEYVEQCCKITKCILLDRKHNRIRDLKEVTRVYSWSEVPKIVEQ